jgi:hypothetical protein
MIGSPLAAVIIPIVSVISLAFWLVMIFYADAHPGYRENDAMAERRSAGEIPSKHGREPNDRPESISSGNLGSARESRDAAQPGEEVANTGPLPERPAA